MTLQRLPSALPSRAWIPSGWHTHASADGDLWNYIILKGVPSMRKSITTPCTLKQALHGECVTSVTWKLSFQPCFFSFWRNPPMCFIHLLSLKGENMAHLTSWFLHGCAISLWLVTIFIHGDCSKYWLQYNQMDRARVRKTNLLNYFHSFITDLVILSNLRVCFG